MAFMTSCNQDVFAAAAEGDTGVYELFGHSADINTNHYGHDSWTPQETNIKTLVMNARVSGVFHLLYGHLPTLLQSIQVGKIHIFKLITTIRGIHGCPHTSPVITPSVMSGTTQDDSSKFLVKICKIFESSLTKSHTAVVDLFVDPVTKHP